MEKKIEADFGTSLGVIWVNIGMMENQMEKNMENEMDTGVIQGMRNIS